MKSLKLLCLSILLLVSFRAHSETICSQPKLKGLIAQGAPAFKFKPLLQSIRQSQVVIAGDVHFLTEFKAIAKLVQEFQKQHSKNSCVAFELPAREYDTDTFMNNIVDIVTESEASKDFKTDSDLQNYVETLKRLHIYYFPIVHYATQLNMKVKSVDHKDKWGPMAMDLRNQAINENIQKLLLTKECESVLLVIGKAHLSSDAGQFRIQNLLKSDKFKVTSINLQMTQESAIPEDARSWEVCEGTKLKKVTDYSAIANSSLTGQPVLTGNTLWKDFDFTLLIP